MPVFDRRGQPVGVRERLGQGGEGAVYAVEGAPELVAKLYHRPVVAAQAAKLAAMAALPSQGLRRVAAWPVETLHERPGGAVRGLLMPRVDGRKPIHQVYGPASRRAEFPQADWHFLVRVATNLARAFAVVHAHGQVVGDVNQGNILVAPDATVRLIDCDSFQIVRGDERFLCEVGVAAFQPPELQSLSSFRGLIRTVDHDSFGLAVLIFHLLMLGRHPFAGTYEGGGEMPVERAIRELRFAYGRRAAARDMRPPPLAPTLEVASPAVADFFECAFAPEAARGGPRPSAAAWALALDALSHELVACPDKPGHLYQFRLPVCPWCPIERGAGTVVFPPAALPRAAAAPLDLAGVWAAIESVDGPGPAPALPTSAAPPPSGRRHRSRRRSGVGAPAPPPPGGTTAPAANPAAGPSTGSSWPAGAWPTAAGRLGRIPLAAPPLALALVALASHLLVDPPGRPTATLAALAAAAASALPWLAAWYRRDRRARAARQVRDEWWHVAARWAYEAGDASFLEKRRRLEEARAEYLGMAILRQRRLHQLEAGRRQRTLARHPIRAAAIAGLDPSWAAMLGAQGIETAADLTEDALRRVPGLGRQRAQHLLAWRRQVESPPAAGLERQDLLDLDKELRVRRRQLEQTLRHGAADLRALAQDAQRARATLHPQVERALAALAALDHDD